MIKEMDKEGLETFKKIKALKTASTDDVMMMQNFTKEYIDTKCTICKTCAAQIRFAYQTIINWGAKHQIESLSFEEVQVIDTEEVIDINKEIIGEDSKIIGEETGKVFCDCGEELPDKRYKKCKKCKTK